MGLLRIRRPFLLTSTSAALASALIAAWIGLRLGGQRATLWADDVATPLAAAIACFACLRARARHRGRMRLFWSLLACAMACWTIAEVIWGVYALVLDEAVPSPSWADVGYLLAIPLAVAALIAHPAIRGAGMRRARSTLDGLALATALLFTSWTLVLGPLSRNADLSTSAGIVTLAYPFGDVVIVFFIVLAIREMTGEDRLSLWCLLISLLAMALSDSAFTYLTEVADYHSSQANLIDVGWIVAYLGIATAAVGSRARHAATSAPARATPSLASLVAPLLPILLALGVTAAELELGHRLDRVAWLMAFGLIALVLSRQGLALLALSWLSPRRRTGFVQHPADAAVGARLGEQTQSGGQ
jgi:diguanylate cyclase